MQLANEDWFHGELSRVDAEQRLKQNGDFLVRRSHTLAGEYAVSVQWQSEKIHHICPRTEAS